MTDGGPPTSAMWLIVALAALVIVLICAEVIG
jgi:hypothetical protein